MWPGPHPIPIPGTSLLYNRTVKKKQRTSPLNIISVMCKERSKSARKHLQTGCATYRPDLLFCGLLLDVYFVTSKIGFLNVNDLNFISLNADLKLLNINLMLLNTNSKLLNVNFLLNIKLICWQWKSFVEHIKCICWIWKSFIEN